MRSSRLHGRPSAPIRVAMPNPARATLIGTVIGSRVLYFAGRRCRRCAGTAGRTWPLPLVAVVSDTRSG